MDSRLKGFNMAASTAMNYNPYIMGGTMAGAGLGNMFSPWENPAEAASPYLGQIPSTIAPYYDPYIQGGGQQFGNYMGQANKLTNNPGQMVNEIGSNYQQSPGFEFQMQQALQGGTNAAAAGGYAGTPQHQQYAMQTANDIASQDYNKYMQDALRMYGLGFQGLGQQSQMGYGASNEMAQSLMSALMTQAQLEYEAANAENQHEGGSMGGLLGGIGSMIGGLF